MRNTRDETLANEHADERLRRFNEKLRYSEDLGKEQTFVRKRRTYSDDYDEKTRRESRPLQQPEPLKIKRPGPLAVKRLIDKENRRNSECTSAKSRDFRVNYAEIEFVKKDSCISDARYANFVKTGSVECKSTRQILEIPPRRAFSQTDERPATPIPPIEFNDERYVPKKLSSEPEKRDSSRYKVYLT